MINQVADEMGDGRVDYLDLGKWGLNLGWT